MLDYPDQAVDFLEFWSSIGFQRFIRFFWIFVLLEFPRYVVLDFAGLLITRVARFRRRIDYEAARERLFAERPLVSVLAPGKDEGDNIGRLVRALSEQTYSNLKIIIVDDGSSDHTPQICRRFLRDGRIHRFLRNDIRGGKASAANFGLRYSTGRFVVHVDADCSFDRDALEKVLIPFYLDEKLAPFRAI